MSQTLSPSSARGYGLARVRACGRSRVPASIAPSKRRRRTRHRVALVRSANVRTLNWQSYPPAIAASRLHGKGYHKLCGAIPIHTSPL